MSGVGHPLLRDLWRPALDAAFASGKPICFTSFDEQDKDADVAALNSNYDMDWLLMPQLNPFASLKFDAHLQDPRRFVQNNLFAFAATASC